MFINSLDKEEYFQNSDKFEIQYMLDRIRKEAFNTEMHCYNVIIKVKSLFINVDYNGPLSNLLMVIDTYQKVIDEKFPNPIINNTKFHNSILIDFILRKENRINRF
jgi:hypothetical protein